MHLETGRILGYEHVTPSATFYFTFTKGGDEEQGGEEETDLEDDFKKD